jgi:hypothetical protein
MRWRRTVLLLAAVGLVVTVGPAAWSQQVPRATCLDCHEAEGMEYAVLRNTPFQEVPVGETQDLEVVVANPWLHEISSALVTVNLTDAEGLSFETPDDIARNESTTVELDQPTNITFPVQTGATAVVTRMEQPRDPSGAGANDVDARLALPDGTSFSGPDDGANTGDPNEGVPGEPQPTEPVEQIVVDDPNALASTGNWTFTLERDSGTPDDEVQTSIRVFYNATRVLSDRIQETIGEGSSDAAAFPVQGTAEGEVTVSYTVTLTAYYDHPDGIQSQDEGNETLEGETTFEVGDSLELGDAGPAVPETPSINWQLNARAWGEVTGFIGLFMVPLSLVLGGAFGRRNVLWVNEMVGSARLRVLWHNALSFLLLGFTIVHLILFLYEGAFSWSVGMVWGGTSTLALIGLGITGGFQRRFARGLGYSTWRLLHIGMAVAFIATLLVHVTVDGVHFDWLRSWLGLSTGA